MSPRRPRRPARKYNDRITPLVVAEFELSALHAVKMVPWPVLGRPGQEWQGLVVDEPLEKLIRVNDPAMNRGACA